MAERTTPLIKLNGVAIGRGRTINFVEGTDVDITVEVADQEATVTVTNTAVVGGGAPTDATYLTTTSHASLSAEVPVGATPGGELGNTWASPTVDSSHGGGTHAATQAAAESTASTALTTHAGAVDPHTVYRLESVNHTHASSGLEGGTIDHGAITGLSDDDHSQYRLEADNHTHQSSGAQAGTLDHGAALTGLTDDDHTQYKKETEWDWFEVYATSDVTIQSDATVNNDATLLFAVGTSQVWVFEAVIYYTGDATADLDAGFSAPASTTGGWSATGVNGNQGFNQLIGSTNGLRDFGTSHQFGASTTSAYSALELRGIVVTAGTAGNLQFQWSQDTSTAADTTRRAGSYIKYRRVV